MTAISWVFPDRQTPCLVTASSGVDHSCTFIPARDMTGWPSAAVGNVAGTSTWCDVLWAANIAECGGWMLLGCCSEHNLFIAVICRRLIYFSALTVLVEWQGERPACKNTCPVRCNIHVHVMLETDTGIWTWYIISKPPLARIVPMRPLVMPLFLLLFQTRLQVNVLWSSWFFWGRSVVQVNA